ncbi:MAG: hypothetical protein SF052_04675 [Bacteroidia bacterium]|nr:hypothetical protein [Bacteroidia bacterium]
MKPKLSPALRMSGLFLIFSMLFSSCIFYKKVDVLPTDLGKTPYAKLTNWDEFIRYHARSRPYTLAHTPEGMYYLTVLEYGKDSMRMDAEKISYPFIFPESDFFPQKKIPKTYRTEFLHSTNLYIDKSLNEGQIILLTDDIKVSRLYSAAEALNVVVNTAIAGMGIIAATGIFLAIVCNCPQVYAIAPDGTQTKQGTLFTGAISRSLERTDLLPLQNLGKTGQNLKITVANELPEEEFIDELKLLRTQLSPGAKTGINTNNQLFEYQKLVYPHQALSMNGKNILDPIKYTDSLNYNFSDFPGGNQLNTATFSFKKSDFNTDQPMLIINARQTEWLETVAEVFFGAFGNRFDRWNEMMDQVPVEKYEARTSERGISLNVWIETTQGWKKAGTFHNAGVNMSKRMGLTLDLSQTSGETVNVRLECAYKFWEIDEIGMANDWKEITDYTEVPLISAFDEKGEEVSDKIGRIDQNYAIQPHSGSAITLTFENPAETNEIYVLKGTGYYHHIRNYEHAPDKQFIRYMRANQKTVTQELSVLMDALQKNQMVTNKKP